MEFYTNVVCRGDNILYSGIRNGKHIHTKIPFKPTLYVTSAKANSGWSSLYGDQLEPFSFDGIKDAKEFCKTHDDVAGFEVHGMQDYQYQFIAEKHPTDVQYDINQMRTWFIDIEVVGEEMDSFPNVETATTPIVLISIMDKVTSKIVVYGLKKYNATPEDNFTYREFSSEKDLLISFIHDWQSAYPDIVSGWNTAAFDFPYLINRIKNVLDEKYVKMLSPFGVVQERNTEIQGKNVQTYDIVGVNSIDLLDAYKKFGTYSAKESYALGFIAQEELDKTKLEIEEARSFYDAYTNHFDKMVRYNALDSQLVKEINDKKNLIELIVDLAYLVKCNFKDVFGPVKMWDVFVFHHLMKKKIAVPPRKNVSSDESFEGAWVKEPIPNMYKWIVSVDFSSLYPTIIRQWNISPETMHEMKFNLGVNDLLNFDKNAPNTIDGFIWPEYIKEHGLTMTSNGTMYRKDKKGIFPELMEFLMVERKKAKKEMLKLDQEYQNTHDESLKGKIASLETRQLALKVGGNSGYGAITQSSFRYYDLRIGEAITLTGQLSDKHVESVLNKVLNKIFKTEGKDYVIACDTDSAYFTVEPLVDAYCKGKSIPEIVKFIDQFVERAIQPVINKSIKHIFDMTNAYDFLMDMKRESIASKGFWTAKKRYSMMVHNSEGVDYTPYKLKTLGLDLVKSSTPKFVRKKLKDAVVVIFEKGEDALYDFVEDFRKEFQTLPIEDIAFPRSVSNLTKWQDGDSFKSGTPFHVKAALSYNRRIKKFRNLDNIKNGDKIRFFYLREVNPTKGVGIAFPAASKFPKELNLHQYIDYDIMFEKVFMSPLKSITDAIKWDIIRASSLNDFFV